MGHCIRRLSCHADICSCAYFSKTTVRCFGTLKNSYLLKRQLRLMWTLELICFVCSKFCYCIAKFMTVAWTKQQVMVYFFTNTVDATLCKERRQVAFPTHLCCCVCETFQFLKLHHPQLQVCQKRVLWEWLKLWRPQPFLFYAPNKRPTT